MIKDFKRFVGRSYTQVNCWDLVREFYLLELGIQLNHYYDVPPEKFEHAQLIKSNKGDFVRVEDTPRFGDLILMKSMGIERHIGICLGNGTILHSIRPVGSCIERIEKYERNITGYYRPRDL